MKCDFSYCHDWMVDNDSFCDNMRLKMMAERVCPPGCLIRNAFLRDGGVFRCYRGRFRFAIDRHRPAEIGESESIVVYPGHRITIDALDDVNFALYAVFDGAGVSSCFDRFGFYNGIRGKTVAQTEVFREVKHRLESGGAGDQAKAIMRLADALASCAHDFNAGENALVHKAVRQILKNLKDGIVRLAPLYDQLKVGHTALGNAFKKAGMESPAEFIRQEQLSLAVRRLVDTRMKISQIARESGFISMTHFANFIKHNTGMSARELRNGGEVVIFPDKTAIPRHNSELRGKLRS